MRAQSFSYRPDINGLRAVAVTGVLLYHAPSVASLHGGFLGVDVFFVISGFLITNLISNSMERKEFSLREFYWRRAVRLLPAYFVVLIASIVVSWFVLEPNQMSDFTNSLLYSLLGVSNLYFAAQDSYWAADSSMVPLLHTWSLSVEEQFYLLLPALLIFSARALRGKQTVFFFSVLGISSLAFATWMTETNPTISFFLLPTRAWELLIGVVLALVLRKSEIRLSKSVASFSTAFGLALIAGSMMFIGDLVVGPTVMTLLPTVGTALTILGGTSENPISKLLSFKPVAGLGVISYGLYLWHYPILALSEIAFEGSGGRLQLASLALALCLSVGSFFLIEKRVRQGSLSRSIKASGGAAFSFILIFFLGSAVTSGYSVSSAIPEAIGAHELPTASYLRAPITIESGGTVILLGDSHMQSLLADLPSMSKEIGMDFINGALPLCPFLLGLETGEDCDTDAQSARQQVAQGRPGSFVIIGGRFPLYLEGEPFDNQEGGVEEFQVPQFLNPQSQASAHLSQEVMVSESFKRTARELLDDGHIVVFVYPIPEVGWDVPAEVFSRATSFPAGIAWLGGRERLANFSEAWPLSTPLTTSYSVYKERTNSSFELFDSIQDENVIRVYPHELFCESNDGGRCWTHSETQIFYWDDNHLSTDGALLLNRAIIKGISDWQLPE